MSNANHNPLLIFIRGLPGSGKSHVTYALRDAINQTPVTVIDPDFIDKKDEKYQSFASQLEAEGLDSAIIPFRWLRQCAVEAARERAIIIWNQPFTNKGIFDRLVVYLKDSVTSMHNLDLQILVIEINTSAETAWDRVLKRIEAGGHGPSKDTFNKRCADYTSYKDTYPVLELDGEVDSKLLVQKTLQHIDSML